MLSHERILTVYRLDELIALARAQSPYYQIAYAHLPERPTLAQLPILDQTSYWEAHARDPRELLTTALNDGVVLNSGGSTGTPKFSYYNDEEWDSTVALESRALAATGLKDGDRVANLFASGYLYSSFMLIMESLKAIPAKVLQLPIGYFAPVPDAVRLIRTFRVNVVTGLPTHLMSLFGHIEKERITDLQLTHILFAGEPFTTDQRRYLDALFPGVQVRSVGYASVDAGTMGYADLGCAPGEHRPFDGATILEICDEDTGEVIEEAGRPGRIIFTNLTRRLMPTLRYPTGDRGEWVEPAGTPERKFMLLGRSEESARLASFNIPVAEVSAVLDPFRESLGIGQIQIIITQENLRDLLILRLVSEQPAELLAVGGEQILAALMRQKPVLAEMIAKGVVNPPRIEWVGPGGMETNARTGKMRRVIDRRVG